MEALIEIAKAKAREYRQEQYSAAHLLWATLHNDLGLVEYLEQADKNIFYLRDWAETMIEELPTSGKMEKDPSGDEQSTKVIQVAKDFYSHFKGNESIQKVAACLTALCKSGVGFSEEDLKTFPLTNRMVIDILGSSSSKKNGKPDSTKLKKGSPSKRTDLHKYCIDKTEEARAGNVDLIVGREEELLKITEILGRRNTPNVLLLGEPGVGKSAIVEALAHQLNNNQVPKFLLGYKLFELDLGSLIAGAAYKGEVENRLKKIIQAIKDETNILLFIDEIHQILDPKGSLGTGVANLLKPELARGAIRIIGATTNIEYRKYVEPDPAFTRRFSLIRVEEPENEVAFKMLENIIQHYESYHEIEVLPKAIEEAIQMAKRFYKDRKLPASAIKLIDQGMAAKKILIQSNGQEFTTLLEELDSLIQTKEQHDQEHISKELDWFYYQMSKRISPILWQQAGAAIKLTKSIGLEERIEEVKKVISELKHYSQQVKPIVGSDDITAITAFNTGIPMGKLKTDEKEKLLGLEDILRQRVLGQDHALKTVTETLIDARSGLARSGRPKGSFFFVGPTGTGKTELAKAIASFLFDDEEALIRFDMSEYQSNSDYSKLLGASSGLVGYEEGGLLVNQIREKPYSVVLFDELEKAHHKIYDIFLSILSDGRVTDNKGNLGDFSNAIIIFTSNLGAEKITALFEKQKGLAPSSQDVKEILAQEKAFRAEMIGRLSESVELVPFAPITREVAELIFNLHLKKEVTNNLTKMGIKLNISPQAMSYLVDKGYSKTYGARPIIGVIRNEVRKPISRLIIKGIATKETLINLELDDEKELVFDINKPELIDNHA